MELTNKQWKVVSKFVSSQNTGIGKRGRPPLDKREVVNAILWVLAKGARWKQMPECYPQYQTCRNYYYEWSKTGAMERVLKVLVADEDSEEEDEAIQLDIELAQGGHISKKKLSEFVRKIEGDQDTVKAFSLM